MDPSPVAINVDAVVLVGADQFKTKLVVETSLAVNVPGAAGGASEDVEELNP